MLTPEKLKAFRAENRISRARLAELLGVSSTSVQNWETNTVASMKIQERLAQLIAAGPAAIPPSTKAPSLWDRGSTSSNRGDPALLATGTIVAGYLQVKGGELGVDELLGLIRSVRQALA
ncbi:MAG: helix-turn-helix domain-containing protein [Planctomycetes bacterium]|nr:helix-turn-helix domain-containing protein [Planctomycetota bacterium]